MPTLLKWSNSNKGLQILAQINLMINKNNSSQSSKALISPTNKSKPSIQVKVNLL